MQFFIKFILFPLIHQVLKYGNSTIYNKTIQNSEHIFISGLPSNKTQKMYLTHVGAAHNFNSIVLFCSSMVSN
jgi:hypothetical protein